MTIEQMFDHVSDQNKRRAVAGFVRMNPHQQGIDFHTMMDMILDSDSHLPILGDVAIDADAASKLVDYFARIGETS